MGELMVGLAKYFVFHNDERPHQSLGYKTPDAVYRSGVGGGAVIVDKFARAVEETPCSATLHRGFLHRRRKIRSNGNGRSNTKNQGKGKTGAARSSC